MAAPRDISEEPDWEEITTVSQFRERVGGQFGVIVIEDAAGHEPIFHHRVCSSVREEHFVAIQ